MNHDIIHSFAIDIKPTGSRYICVPPPMDTDEDYVVLAREHWTGYDVFEFMEGVGFGVDTSETYDTLGEYDTGGFMSCKKGEINYIITNNEDFFKRWVTATEAAKTLNLREKPERIVFFRYMLYGVTDNPFN